MPSRRLLLPVLVISTLPLLPVILLGLAIMLAYPTLPSLGALVDYHPKMPLRIYSAEGILLSEFGEERRALVKIAEVPEVMKNAILAAEDDSFYEHGGVDYMPPSPTLCPVAQNRVRAPSPCRWRAIFSFPRKKP